MTANLHPDSCGPYAFTLDPGEAEVAGERLGLRIALKGQFISRHAAPLAAFGLTLLFASILAWSGLIGRRAGEATIILAAAAFMAHRAAARWRIWRARRRGKEQIAELQSAGPLTVVFGEDAVLLRGGGMNVRLSYDDCEDAESAGGLIYVWPRRGVPIVAPIRALGDAEEGKRIVAGLLRRIRRSRRKPGRPPGIARLKPGSD